MKIRKQQVSFYGMAVLLAICVFVICYSQVLYSFDKIFADKWYQVPTSTNKDIKIIAIDEKTVQAYGDIKTWTRDIPADLVETLMSEEENAPAIIAFDILYIGEVETRSDERFARACKEAGNVITCVNAGRRTKLTRNEDGTLHMDKGHVDMVEYPYDALREATLYGFVNTSQDLDGYIRYARTYEQYGEEEIPSFALQIYKQYCTNKGTDPVLPKTFSDDMFSFSYSGKSGAYEVISLCDVLEGKMDSVVFKDSIVLVGAYASGMQDAYNVAVQRGAQMYGVEIHANVLEALMEEKTGRAVPMWGYALVAVLLVVAFYFICARLKPLRAAWLLMGMILADLLVCRLLYQNGFVTELTQIPLFLIFVYFGQLARSYLIERWRRRKVISAFRKYVEPHIVDEISKQGDFKISLGGENRDIAVLFVDIRGFTTLSESLMPEQVVEILNDYLKLTTNVIFKYGGTLDKFMGDASMALFNAPIDLDDYVYKAVCAARDIVAGSAELDKKMQERFGKNISFGIGINCGNAVVGNIGCEFRMDYTAIGDTVNTAARLESTARPGQILISANVYERVKDRVEVTEIGMIPLKGKSNEVFVYQVDKVY